MDEYAEIIANAWQQSHLPSSVSLIIEPGARAVTSCGSLLTCTTSIKQRAYGPVVFLDMGHNLLPGADYHEYSISALQPSSAATEPRHYMLCGSLCDSWDNIAAYVVLPVLCPGDVLCISDVGSYDMMCSFSWQIPRARAIWVDPGQGWKVSVKANR
ncbi:MAG TPA: hypothetical protein VMT34_08375 [Aggregatilineales bacterium]|nr:hypothetical protein [Aggregatilineales bacterium]